MKPNAPSRYATLTKITPFFARFIPSYRGMEVPPMVKPPP